MSMGTYENNSGYRMLMQGTPLQPVIALTDSPLGNLAFDWVLMHALSDPVYEWSLEQIITWGMMYWIPGPYAAMRHYREMALHGVFAGTDLWNAYPYVEVPVGLSEWPGDFWYRLVSPIFFQFFLVLRKRKCTCNTWFHFPNLSN